MSESERRRKYHYGRVLIETARVLSSTFDDAVVYLSGVQLEMLRNVTQYLRRLDTYVSEYNPGYYLTPTSADYDDILAIVADLEETLMGNPNILWGYSESYRYWNDWSDPGAGHWGLQTTPIAAGKVARLEGVGFKDTDSVIDRLIIFLRHNFQNYPLVDIANPAADVWHSYSFDRTMEAGDQIIFDCYGVVLNDELIWTAVGRQMDIPT